MDPSQQIATYGYDLGRLCTSLLEKGFLKGERWSRVETELTDSFILPHIQKIGSLDDKEVHIASAIKALEMAELSYKYKNLSP